MTNAVDALRQEAFEAKHMYVTGKISREEAKEKILPFINTYNEKAVTIAKKYEQRPKILSFAGFLR